MKTKNKKTIIEITMPYGKRLIEKYLQSPTEFQKADERIIFKWSELYGG